MLGTIKINDPESEVERPKRFAAEQSGDCIETIRGNI